MNCDSALNDPFFDGGFPGLDDPSDFVIFFGGVVAFVATLLSPADVNFPLVERILKVAEPVEASAAVKAY